MILSTKKMRDLMVNLNYLLFTSAFYWSAFIKDRLYRSNLERTETNIVRGLNCFLRLNNVIVPIHKGRDGHVLCISRAFPPIAPRLGFNFQQSSHLPVEFERSLEHVRFDFGNVRTALESVVNQTAVRSGNWIRKLLIEQHSVSVWEGTIEETEI